MDVSERLPWTQPNPPPSLRRQQNRPPSETRESGTRVPSSAAPCRKCHPPSSTTSPDHVGSIVVQVPTKAHFLGVKCYFQFSDCCPRSPLGLVAEEAAAEANAFPSCFGSLERRVGVVGVFCNINISILRIRSLLNYSQNGFPHPSPKQTTGHPDELFLHIFRKKIK